MKTFSEVLGKYGKEYLDEVRVKVMGTQPKDTFRIIKENTGVDVSPEQLGEEIHGLLRERMHLAQFMPGKQHKDTMLSVFLISKDSKLGHTSSLCRFYCGKFN